MGEGSNVCSRGWEQESPTASLSQGSLSRRPWPRRRYGEPEKIRLTFGANSCKLPQLILFVHSDL